jgi:hypothetical protein
MATADRDPSRTHSIIAFSDTIKLVFVLKVAASSPIHATLLSYVCHNDLNGAELNLLSSEVPKTVASLAFTTLMAFITLISMAACIITIWPCTTNTRY